MFVHPRATAPAETTPNAVSSSDEAYAQNGQDRKLAFVNASIDRRTTSPIAYEAGFTVRRAGRVRDISRTHHGPPL
jgi:type IV secretion system protein VirB10